MDFGQAIEAMKAGKKVARAGWNGKGMWVALTPGKTIPQVGSSFNGAAALLVESRPGDVVLSGHLDMKAADGSLVIGWLASQTDMLAEDWSVIG